MRPSALMFAYATNGNLANSVLDIFRALIAPRSFGCRLCELTFTPLGLKPQWLEHLKSLSLPYAFIHRNELKKKYGMGNVDLPAVFRPQGDRLVLMIEAREINHCKDLDALIRLLDRMVA
jgi:hypothetical protein